MKKAGEPKGLGGEGSGGGGGGELPLGVPEEEEEEEEEAAGRGVPWLDTRAVGGGLVGPPGPPGYALRRTAIRSYCLVGEGWCMGGV